LRSKAGDPRTKPAELEEKENPTLCGEVLTPNQGYIVILKESNHPSQVRKRGRNERKARTVSSRSTLMSPTLYQNHNGELLKIRGEERGG